MIEELKDWHSLLPKLGLRGLTNELAKHCAAPSWSDPEYSLKLDPSQKFLLSQESKLEQALCDYFKRDIRLRLILQTSTESPADVAAKQAAMQREQIHAIVKNGGYKYMIEEILYWENFHKKLGLTGPAAEFAEKLAVDCIDSAIEKLSREFYDDFVHVKFSIMPQYKALLQQYTVIEKALRDYFGTDSIKVSVRFSKLIAEAPESIAAAQEKLNENYQRRMSERNVWMGCADKKEEARLSTTKQVGGTHYVECKIQPVEFIEANSLGFLEGCVVKRLVRHNKPTGKGKQDIEKAIHELQLLLEKRYA